MLTDRPASDQSITDAQIYVLLSEAQEYWYSQFAIHCPHVLMAAPTTMTAVAGNKTYTFPSSVRPLYVLVYESASGNLLRPGSYDDPNADYVWEDDKIRLTRDQARTWTDGPTCRIVAPPVQITASVAPTLKPEHARVLLIYHAAAEWARRGGKRDPAPFERKEHELAWGKDGTGDIGIVGALKMANPFKGMEAFGHRGFTGYAYIATVRGY